MLDENRPPLLIESAEVVTRDPDKQRVDSEDQQIVRQIFVENDHGEKGTLRAIQEQQKHSLEQQEFKHKKTIANWKMVLVTLLTVAIVFNVVKQEASAVFPLAGAIAAVWGPEAAKRIFGSKKE